MKARTVTKAGLKCWDDSRWHVTFPFNPTAQSMKLRRRVHWDPDGSDGAHGGALSGWEGKPDEFEFEILLDESVKEPPGLDDPLEFAAALIAAMNPLPSIPEKNTNSIVPMIEKLYRLTMPVKFTDTSKKPRPPVVSFTWGDFEFMGTITDLDVDFQLFASDGTPKRATVGFSMEGRALSTNISSVEQFLEDDVSPPTATGSGSRPTASALSGLPSLPDLGALIEAGALVAGLLDLLNEEDVEHDYEATWAAPAVGGSLPAPVDEPVDAEEVTEDGGRETFEWQSNTRYWDEQEKEKEKEGEDGGEDEAEPGGDTPTPDEQPVRRKYEAKAYDEDIQDVVDVDDGEE